MGTGGNYLTMAEYAVEGPSGCTGQQHRPPQRALPHTDADLAARFEADLPPALTHTTFSAIRFDVNDVAANLTAPPASQSFSFEAWVRVTGNSGRWRTGMRGKAVCQ